MKNKVLVFVTGCLIFGAAALVLILPKTGAQISSEQKAESEEAIRIVKSRPLSKEFYETVKTNQTAKAATWNLQRALFKEQSVTENRVRTGDYEEWYLMEFQNSKTRIQVSIFEYESPEKASEVLRTIWNSQGEIKKTNEFGDEGLKGYTDSGKLIGMRFRKDRFAVFISCENEETLKTFAGYALRAIAVK